MPRFSVVVPAYNAEETLSETLDAIRAQEFTDWECVIVDDGSADGTLALARTYENADLRFRAVTQENRGTGGAYNTGVRAAVGEWVTICSADDVLLEMHLGTMAEVIEEHSGYDIYSCNGYLWRPDGSREIAYPPLEGTRVRSWSLDETFMNCFFSVGATYRRTLFDEVGGYREDVFGEDYDFWLRAMMSGARHLYVDDALSLHRTSATQKSADLERSFRSDILILTSALNSGLLSPSQKKSARAAIRHRKRLISGRNNTLGMRLKRRAQRELTGIRRFAGRLIGAAKRRVLR